MKVLLLVVALSLAALAAGEAPSPSRSYGAPSRPAQPQPRPQAQPQQPQAQPQAFAQSRALPAFSAPASFSPLSGAGLGLFSRQFFIPAPDPARLSELNRLPNEYDPPPATFTTTEAAPTTTEVPTTISPADFSFAGSRNGALREAEESGVYYVLQPDGRLQRIAYAHGPAPAPATSQQQQQQQQQQQRAAPSEVSALQQPALTPGYLARFQYQDLHPAGAPIYSYKQPELVRIN